MDDFNDLEELIDKYLADDMSAEERLRFEDKAMEDPKLHKMLEETRLIQIGIKKIERDRIMQKIKATANKHSKNQDIPKPISRHRKLKIANFKWIGVAAAILLVLTLGILFYNLSDKNNISDLQTYLPFNEYEPLASRGMNEEMQQLENTWILYEKSRYAECLQVITSISEPSNYKNEYNFLEGLCLLSLKKYGEAIEPLKSAAQSNFRYQEDAQWYLGLTYLGLDQKELAKEVLSKIVNEKYPVKDVLQEIE